MITIHTNKKSNNCVIGTSLLGMKLFHHVQDYEFNSLVLLCMPGWQNGPTIWINARRECRMKNCKKLHTNLTLPLQINKYRPFTAANWYITHSQMDSFNKDGTVELGNYWNDIIPIPQSSVLVHRILRLTYICHNNNIRGNTK